MKKAEIALKILPLIALAFAVFLLPVGSVALNTQENVTVNVTNVAPVVGTVNCTAAVGGVDFPFTPTAGANFTVKCEGIITDNNGWEDINQSTFKAAFTPGGLAAENDSDDLNSHYTNGTASNSGTDCVWSGGAGTSVTVNCGFYVMSYVDSSNWSAIFRVKDSLDSQDTVQGEDANISGGFEIQSVLGLDLVGPDSDTDVTIGSIALGATSSEKSITVFTVANRDMDVDIDEISGNTFGGVVDGLTGNLTCRFTWSNNISTSGVAGEGLRYNKTPAATFAQRINVTGAATTYTDFSLAYTNASGTTHKLDSQNLSLMVQIPSTGVRGLCGGSLRVVAVNNV